jgi:tripartite-type tricarboxylate transporter receptor subunit TctC
MNRRDVLKLGVAFGGLTLGHAVLAQQYPQKPINLIVPFAPGGNLDTVARIIAPSLSRILGQPVMVQNRPGAGGVIGVAEAARADADGYTLLVSTPNAVSVVPQMVKANYRVDSFRSVGLVATTSLALVVKGNDSRFKDAASFLSYAKSNPKKVSVGYAGIGTTNHVALMQLEEATHSEFTTVAYKGSAPALTDLIGGQIDAVVDQLTSSISHVNSGGLRALAVLSRERDPLLKATPTLREAGVAEFEVTTSTGLLAPAKTPQATIDILHSALQKTLADAQIKARLLGVGSVARPSAPQDFQQLLEVEDKRARALVKAGRLKAE